MIDQFNTYNDNISLVRGDTLAFGFEVYDDDIPFTQDLGSCYFSVRRDYSAADYVFQKSLRNGIEKVSTGKYRVRIAPEDTASLEVGNYYYDLQIGVNGDYFTLMRGLLELEYDITRESFALESAISKLCDGSISSLSQYDIGNVVTLRSRAFSNCTDLVKIILPDSVQSIGSYAFQNCSKLESISIPDGVTVIPEYIFQDCTAIKKIILPDSVTTIERYAFLNCTAMENLTCKATTPPTLAGSNVFNSMRSACNIYVPADSVDAYKAAQYWSARAQHIQAIQV